MKRTALASLALLSCLSAPLAAETLTVYTYDSFTAEWGPGPKIKQAFEQECGCTLNFVALEDGVAILNRLRLEGRHGKADLVLGLDDGLLGEAKQTGLFAPHGVDLAPLALPGGWRDETFLPYDYGWFAFVYDQTRLKNPPRSMQALLARDDLKIIYQDPRTSTPGQGLLLWLKALYGDQSGSQWETLAKKTVTVTKGWSEAYGMFLKGEADMVLSYTSSPAYHRIAEGKQQYHAALFDEGHYRQVEVVARLAASQHPELARRFLDFVLTRPFQDAVTTGNWMYPVTETPLPEQFASLPLPAKTLTLAPAEVSQQRKGWIREWLQAVTR